MTVQPPRNLFEKQVDLTRALIALLPGHAGHAFLTEKPAEDWLGRTRKNPRAAMNDIYSGVRGFDLHAARIRRAKSRARVETCLVLVRPGECPREVIEAAHGKLKEYALIPKLDPVEVFPSKRV